MSSNHKLAALGLVVLFAIQVSIGAVGIVAAQDAGNETLADRQLDVDDDDRALYVSAQNSTDVLDVSIYELDDQGLSTQVDSGTLDATGNSTATYEYSSLDPANVSQYRVLVEGPTNASADEVEVGTVSVVTGGGILPGGYTPSAPVLGALGVVLVVALIAGFMVWSGRV